MTRAIGRAREAIAAARARRADNDHWYGATSLAELGEVTARWLEGDIGHNDGYNGRPDHETEVLTKPLAAANRAGYVTHGSQPGGRWSAWTQRAAVEGFAVDAHAAARLAEVGERHGLTVITRRAPMLRNDYSRSEVVTVGDDDRGYVAHTDFGAGLSRYTIRDGMIIAANDDVLDEAAEAWQVTLMDPGWGSNARLVAALDEFSGRTPDGPAAVFSNEQVIEHASQRDADGEPRRGTVVHPPCGGPPALVWAGADESEPLAEVAADLRPYVPAGLPSPDRFSIKVRDIFKPVPAEPASDLPELAVCPESGMAQRRMDDGRWYPLDVTGTEGDTAPPPGSVAYMPDGASRVYHCDDPDCNCEKPGRWYTEAARIRRQERRRETLTELRPTARPSTATPAPTGGTAMSVLEVRGQVHAATGALPGPAIQGAINELEQRIGHLSQTLEGSNDSEAHAAVQMLLMVKGRLEEAGQAIRQAEQQLSTYAGRI